MNEPCDARVHWGPKGHCILPAGHVGRHWQTQPPESHWVEAGEIRAHPDVIRKERDRILRQLAACVEMRRVGLPVDPDVLSRLRLDVVVLDDLVDLAIRRSVDV